jgi:polar amino acid transport system substrate-binding protein
MVNTNRRSFLDRWGRWTLSLGGGAWMLPTHGANAKKPDTGQPSEVLTPASDLQWLANQGELVVGFVSQDDVPFFYEKGNETVGLEIDLAKRFARSINLRLRVDRSARTYQEIVDLVADKKIHIGFHSTPTFKRVQKVSFSNAYSKLPHSLILNRVELAKLSNGSGVDKVLRQFSGTMGILANSAWDEFANENFPKAKVIGFPSWEAVADAVFSGRIICGYRNEFYTRKILKSNPSRALSLKIVSFNDLSHDLSFAVSHDNKILKELLNKFVSHRPGQLHLDQLLTSIV